MLSDGEHERVGLERLELPRAHAAGAVGQHLHLLDDDLVLAELLHRGQPLDLHAFGEGFHGLVGVRFHLRLVEAEDDDRLFRAQALGDARRVHRGVAAADDADDAAERRRAALLDLLHQRDGVDDLAAVHGRDVEVVGDLRADGEEDRVERARRLLGVHVRHARVADDRHAHLLDARDFPVEPLARQAIGGDPVVHHPARLGVGVADLDLVPEASQVIGARQARGAGADHEHALAGRRPRRDRPAFLDGAIAEEPIERVDRDGLIEEAPVAGAFTGVIARAAVRGRKRVLLHVLPPGALVVARLREVEPGLDVLAGRAGVIARRQMIDVDRELPSTRAGALADRLLVDRRQILRNQTHGCLHLAPAFLRKGLETKGFGRCKTSAVVESPSGRRIANRGTLSPRNTGATGFGRWATSAGRRDIRPAKQDHGDRSSMGARLSPPRGH